MLLFFSDRARVLRWCPRTPPFASKCSCCFWTPTRRQLHQLQFALQQRAPPCHWRDAEDGSFWPHICFGARHPFQTDANFAPSRPSTLALLPPHTLQSSSFKSSSLEVQSFACPVVLDALFRTHYRRHAHPPSNDSHVFLGLSAGHHPQTIILCLGSPFAYRPQLQPSRSPFSPHAAIFPPPACAHRPQLVLLLGRFGPRPVTSTCSPFLPLYAASPSHHVAGPAIPVYLMSRRYPQRLFLKTQTPVAVRVEIDLLHFLGQSTLLTVCGKNREENFSCASHSRHTSIATQSLETSRWR